jgi:uncharacterized protein YdaU (DUF1376 family)
MHLPARLLVTTLLAATAATACASDDAAAWRAGQQAQARATLAQQALSDRYTAIWSSLDASQKTRFSAQERAWLNTGRQQELQACVAGRGARSEHAVKSCEAEVTERHLRALTAPQRVASSI